MFCVGILLQEACLYGGNNHPQSNGKTPARVLPLSEFSSQFRNNQDQFALGKRGYGYDVVDLLNFFKKILNQDRLTNVGLVGVGNLGHALLNYNFRQANNIRISAGFDINPELAGTIQSGVPIYPMDEMIKQIKDQQIEIVILTVPIDAAQHITDDLVKAGIKGIMNFTPIRISVPSYVRVQNVDLATELQTLIYFLEHYGPTLKEPEA